MNEQERWINEYLDGQLRGEQFDQFQDWLRADERNRELFVACAFDDRTVHDHLAGQIPFSDSPAANNIDDRCPPEDAAEEAQLPRPATLAAQDTTAFGSDSSHVREPSLALTSSATVPCEPRSRSLMRWASRRPLVPSFGITVAIFVALLLGLAAIPVAQRIAGDDGGKDAESRQPEGKADRIYVAILNHQYKAAWLEGKPLTSNDPRLEIGRKLVLASGVIEVKYYTGARVVIEGPAEFVVGRAKGEGNRQHPPGGNLANDNASFVLHPPHNSGYLAHGSLVALVEGEKAKGFTIDTPHASIEDFGTEFGVDVERSGAAEFVVLTGEVDLVRKGSRNRPVERIRLTEKQGAFVTAKAGKIRRRTKVDVRVIASYRKRLDTIRAITLPTPGAGMVYNGGGRLSDDDNWVGGVRPTGTDIGTIAIDDTMTANSAYNPMGATFNQTGNLDFDGTSFNLHTDVTYNLSAGSMANVGTWNINGASVVFNISGGSVRADKNSLYHGSKLNMLAGSGTVAVGELAATVTTNGTINFDAGWTGSYTADNYDGTSNWETLFTTGIDGVFATLNGQSINADTFAKQFVVSDDGRTLRLAQTADAHDK